MKKQTPTLVPKPSKTPLPPTYPILPEHIALNGFYELPFPTYEDVGIAKAILGYVRWRKQGWEPFDLMVYAKWNIDRGVMVGYFLAGIENYLIADPEDKNLYHFTHEFVTTCLKSSPAMTQEQAERFIDFAATFLPHGEVESK